MTRMFQCQTCGGTYMETQLDGSLYFHACPPQPVDLNPLQIDRPDKRDENVRTDRKGARAGIFSEGKGVRCLTDARVSEPAWITAMKQQLAREVDRESEASDV